MTTKMTATNVQPAPEELKALVRKCLTKRGYLYSPVPHPDFDDWPAGRRNDKRTEIIRPHLDTLPGTALDIGAYFGGFSHLLEELGYEVTAVERSPLYVDITRQVRDLTGKTFEIFEGDFYNLEKTDYDLVLALNIFHHSFKKQSKFERLLGFLGRLKCSMMIYEAHGPDEVQMSNAVLKLSPQEAAEFIAEKSGMSNIEEIGMERHRCMFKIT